MAFTPIRTVPTELPEARLYLEDIETIARLLLESVPKDDAGQPVNIVYKINGEIPDSIEDLKRLGTVVKALEISAGPCDVTIGRFSLVHSFGLHGDAPWKLHHSVKQVFERRPQRLIRLIGPSGTRWALVLIFFLSFGTAFALKQVYKEQYYHLRLTVALVGTVLPLVLLLFSLYASAGYGSRVCLFYHHEQSKASAALRKDYAKLVIGTIFGIVATLIIQWFWHRLFG